MIRMAEREDLERINELRRQVNDVHCKGRPDIFKPGFCKELEEIILKMFEEEENEIIVALKGEVICGYACIDYVHREESPYNLERRYYHVNEFGVDQAFRRQGIATELFEFMKLHAKEKGFEKIELDMWEFNEGALKFYESTGFYTYRRYMEYNTQ